MPLLEETVLLLEALQLSGITAAQINAWTDHDPILLQFRDLVMRDGQLPILNCHLINAEEMNLVLMMAVYFGAANLLFYPQGVIK